MSDLIAELSLRTMWHMTCCTWWTPDVLQVICTQLRSGHLSILVGDSSRCTEEIRKISNCSFQYNYYYSYYSSYYYHHRHHHHHHHYHDHYYHHHYYYYCHYLHRWLHVLPHYDRSCRSNLPSHLATVYWYWTSQSKQWPCFTRHLVGLQIQGHIWSHYFFFFFCFPSCISGVHHYGWDFCSCDRLFFYSNHRGSHILSSWIKSQWYDLNRESMERPQNL